MSKKQTTIEINGRRYDAASGVLLPGGPVAPDVPAPSHVVRPTPKEASHHSPRQAAKPVHGHAPKVARTLMRQAVRKPAANKKQLRVQIQAADLAAEALAAVKSPKSAQQIDTRRLQQAKRVPRSRLISHFSAATAQPALSAYVPPAEPLQAVSLRAARPAPSKARRPQTTSELLDLALQSASSHKAQPLPAKRRRRRGRLAAAGTVATLLLVAGMASYSQLPAAKLQTASAKAGFSASLPSYKPAGYSLQSLNSGPGTVASRFHSNSDDRNYTVTQRQSSWSSDQLRDDFVRSIDPYYQSVQSGERTIYLYGEGNASWVSDGIWYIVQSHGSLTDRQLLDLAGSL